MVSEEAGEDCQHERQPLGQDTVEAEREHENAQRSCFEHEGATPNYQETKETAAFGVHVTHLLRMRMRNGGRIQTAFQPAQQS